MSKTATFILCLSLFLVGYVAGTKTHPLTMTDYITSEPMIQSCSDQGGLYQNDGIKEWCQKVTTVTIYEQPLNQPKAH